MKFKSTILFFKPLQASSNLIQTINMLLTVSIILVIQKVTSELCYNNETMSDAFTLEYTKTLSELPLDRLLMVKNSFDFKENLDIEQTISSEAINQTLLGASGLNSTSPEAMALFGHQASDKEGYGGGGHSEHYQYSGYDHKHVFKEKKSKFLSTLFQISIVSLAFLAFGGYLLCLIVQAIKAKAQINMNMTAQQVQTIYRRRRRRKPIRLRPAQIRPRPKRAANYTDFEDLPNVDYEELYRALTMFSEGYAQYHQTVISV